MRKVRNIQVIVSHVYREGNFVADKLANLGLTVTNFTWWHTTPPSIRDDLLRIEVIVLSIGLISFFEGLV
jgi:hypothetical protein